jgi:hypothetical protein
MKYKVYPVDYEVEDCYDCLDNATHRIEIKQKGLLVFLYICEDCDGALYNLTNCSEIDLQFLPK